MNPNFQKIFDSFKGNITFKTLIDTKWILPDEILYEIETNNGTYFVIQIDVVTSFNSILLLVKERKKHSSRFIEPKVQQENAVKYYILEGNTAADFAEYRKYVCFAEDKNNDIWLTFLIKK